MDSKRYHQHEYEPPRVEDLATQDGPAVTAAGVAGGDSPPPAPGPEWRPVAPEDSEDPAP